MLVNIKSVRERQLSLVEERIPGFHGAKILFIPNKPPVKFDGCREDFYVQHALICKKGALITQKHNEIRVFWETYRALHGLTLKKSQ